MPRLSSDSIRPTCASRLPRSASLAAVRELVFETQSVVFEARLPFRELGISFVQGLGFRIDSRGLLRKLALPHDELLLASRKLLLGLADCRFALGDTPSLCFGALLELGLV